LTRLFRSRSKKIELDPRVSSQESCEPCSSLLLPLGSLRSSPAAEERICSSSLLKNSLPPKNKKSRPITNRGMSSVRTSDSNNECDQSPSASWYSLETREGRDVGVLSDLTASYGGHGDFHAQVLC
jgi:hypothetical protein